MSPSQLGHTDHAMIEWCARNGLDPFVIPADELEVRPEQGILVAAYREVIEDVDPPRLSPPLRRTVDTYPPRPLALRRHKVRYDVTLDDSGRPASWSVRVCDCSTPWRHVA